jgi:hypothetical protein
MNGLRMIGPSVPGLPDPPPHARQLTPGHVLASVTGLPGSAIELLESEIPVGSMPPSHVRGAATRGLPAPHQLADQVRVVAVLLRDCQVVVRTKRSRHRLRGRLSSLFSEGRGVTAQLDAARLVHLDCRRPHQ